MNLTATMLLNTTGFAAPLAQLQTQLAGALAQLQGFTVSETAAGAAGAAAAPGIAAEAAATGSAGAAATAAAGALSAFTAGSAAAATAATAATGAVAGLAGVSDQAGGELVESAVGAQLLSTNLALLTSQATAATGALLALRAVASAPAGFAAGVGAARLALPAAAIPAPRLPGGGAGGGGGAAAGAAAGLGAFRGGFVRLLAPVAAAVAALTGFVVTVGTVRSAVSEAAQLEDFETSFTTLLGSVDAAKQRIQDLVVFADTTPFELPQVAAASKILEKFTDGTLAVGEGLRMVGDSAAVLDPSRLAEVALWMGRLFDALRQGTQLGEPLQNLTQLGLISGEVRRQMMALSGQSLTSAEALATMQQAFSSNSGAMERLAATYTGRLSTMRDAWSATLRAFGAPMRDALKPMIIEATEFFARIKPQAAAAGEAIAAGLRVGRQAFADGRLGELAGAMLKLGFAEGINWLSKALPAAFSAQLAVVTTPGYWTGMANAIGAALQGLGAVLMGAFAQPIAFLNAAIDTAAQNIGFAARTAFAVSPLGRLTGATPGEVPRTFDENHQARIAEVEKYTTDLVDGAAASAADAMAGLAEAARAGAAAFSKAMADAADAVDTSGMRAALRTLVDELDAAAKGLNVAPVDPAKPDGLPPGEGGGTDAIKGSGKSLASEGDRLARIGGFVGADFGAGVLADPLQRTAENTERTAEGIGALVRGGLQGFGPSFNRVPGEPDTVPRNPGEPDTVPRNPIPETPLVPEAPPTPIREPGGTFTMPAAIERAVGEMAGAADGMRAAAESMRSIRPPTEANPASEAVERTGRSGIARAAAFVGGEGGPALDYARRTAENTGKFIDALKELTAAVEHLDGEPAWG